jgi:rhodanese-related sulfurtransferase
MKTEHDFEIDIEEAKKLVAEGKKVMLFESNYSEVQLLSETFGIDEEKVEIIDINDFRIVHMHYGEEDEIKKVAGKFEEAVIVCQHGNTSRVLADALAENGVKAYSLYGGIAGILSG